MTPDESKHGMWSSRWLFVLAAAGSAVGLGNIWKFPYIAGENGGGVFVVAYLFCVALVGVPVMMAEVLMGRQGRQSPINSMRALVQQSDGSKAWSLIGWAGVAAGFLILSFYSVIAGWGLYYIGQLASGSFAGVDGTTATQALAALHSNPILMAVFHTVFMGLTVFIVARGVVSGLERAIRWLMPLLFILLIVLLGYGVASGGFAQGFDFMFGLRWEALSVDGLLVALGHAFFTLSIGMGAIMAYGAYVPSSVSITRTVITIAALDTVVALIAGLAIFSIVFANGLEPGSGPGLMFVTVPLAFGQMPLGALFGGIFFILVSFAAITSAISLTEPAIAFLVEEYNVERSRVAVSLGAACWLLGLASVFSFNVWSDVYVVGEKTVFDSIDYLTANIMLPLGGLFIALFAGYVLPKATVMSQLGISSKSAVAIWTTSSRVIAPLGVLIVFLYTIWPAD
ncbi:MAG: sodium-dependent transporter [Pseudomonadales bacterium]|nr:sodium-dependent transporter [Pseudomonadales bacterium]